MYILCYSIEDTWHDRHISVNPISTRGDRLCPPNYYWHPRIFRPSDGHEEPFVHHFIKKFDKLFYTEVVKWDLFNKEETFHFKWKFWSFVCMYSHVHLITKFCPYERFVIKSGLCRRAYVNILRLHTKPRGTSILGEVRNVEISRVTQQLLCSKSHDFQAVFALAHSTINQIA